MKRVICVVAGLMAFAVSSAAQAPTSGQKVSFATNLQNTYGTLKGNLTRAAEAMPEANYGFKPAPDPELRTYGQWIGHQADNQFTNCATLKGVTSPSPAQSNEKKATKAELVRALADAFAFCDGALSALTDQNALQMRSSRAMAKPRGAVVSALLSHGLESYGITSCICAPKASRRRLRRPLRRRRRAAVDEPAADSNALCPSPMFRIVAFIVAIVPGRPIFVHQERRRGI